MHTVLAGSSLQGVNIAPSAYDLYDENEIVSALAQLIFDHIHLKRYLVRPSHRRPTDRPAPRGWGGLATYRAAP